MDNNVIQKLHVEPYDFLFYTSPTIPYDFPKERLPKSLCEVSLLTVMKCYLDFSKQSEELLRAKACHSFSHEFNQCKRRRDMAIFNEIRDWEREKFTGLKNDNKEIYIKSLEEELGVLKNDFEKIPASESTAEKRWRINADIMQTKWRIEYLKAMFT